MSLYSSHLLSEAFVMTLNSFAINNRAIPSPISPIDRIPHVANGFANESIANVG